MKNRSLLGPLLLILIGVLFLVKRFWPELAVLETVVRFWPFLLIAWGLFRLLQIFSLRAQGRPLPYPGINGGEWALIILLTIFGSSVWGLRRYSEHWPGNIRIGGVELLGEAYDYPIDATRKFPKQARLIVENLRGTTRVVGVDGDDITVSGRKMIRAIDRGDADRTNQSMPLEVSSTADQVVVRTNQERASEGKQVSADIEIRVPRGCSVEARGRHGDLDVSDIQGEVTLNGESGGYRVQNIGGAVRVNARHLDLLKALDLKGDIEVKGGGKDLEFENIAGQVTINGVFSGESTFRNLAKPLRFESEVTKLRLEKLPGQMELTLANLNGFNIGGPFVLETKAKDVSLSEVSNGIQITVDRGNVELRQSKLPLPPVEIDVRSGDVEVALPAGAKYSLNAASERGEVTNDLDARLKEENEGRGCRLTGTTGAGPSIKVVTRLGNVTMRKLGVGETTAPEPPPAPNPARPMQHPAPPKPPPTAVNQ
jgi:hypothetical protein